PAMKEWSTKAVRDAFFASPLFPRLLNGDSVKETIAWGVENGVLAYVGKGRSGRYEPFLFGTSLSPDEVEISDEMFILTGAEAKTHGEPPRLAALVDGRRRGVGRRWRVPGRAGRGWFPSDSDRRRCPWHGERDRGQARRHPAAGGQAAGEAGADQPV